MQLAASAGGGTFTQAGIRQARILLESPNSTADHKNIVFLSDGEPTYKHAIDKINSNRNPDYFVQLVVYGTQETTWLSLSMTISRRWVTVRL